MASPFARIRAKNNSREVSNSWHQTINLNDLQIALVQLLDGKNNREAIIQGAIDKCVAGDLKLANNNVPVTDKATIEHLVRQLIPQAINDLRRLGLLVQP